MLRGCPATRRMNHSFDPATHRCKCGRWERGFAPKKEPVTPKMECQVCERHQATSGQGCMVHHGYQRPGCGFIIGDCFGVGHKPYPATDALERYLTAIQKHLAGLEGELASLPDVTSLPFNWSERIDRQKVERVTQIVKGEPPPRCSNYCVPSFEDLLQRKEARLKGEIQQVGREIKRVEERIAKAGACPV